MIKTLFFLISFFILTVNRASGQNSDVLTLALYPFVPDIERFKSAITEEWGRHHPDIRLEYSAWDCYSGTLPENVDVFVYDSIYFDKYLKQGLLHPLSKSDINDIDDFFPFAIDACTTGEIIYAVPEFLCSEFLYTRNSDTEMNNIENIQELYNVIGELDPAEGLLPLNEGLLVTIPDYSNASFWLIQALVDAEQTEKIDITFPLNSDEIPQEASDSLWMVREMAGIEDMTLKTENNSPYIYGEWFTDGVGRAFIGFSEAMSAMGNSTKEIDFRLYSMTEEPNIPLFYMDVASINANISQEKQVLALELLNLITGTDILVQASSPSERDQNYQYLLSARKSFYDVLGQKDPIYTELKSFVSSPDNHIFSVRNEDLVTLYDTSLVTSLLRKN